MIAAFGTAVAQQHRCSRTACTNTATWAIVWRNPKIHREDRRKTWLACDAHRDYLADFLATRDFPLSVMPVTELIHTRSPAAVTPEQYTP